MKVRTDVWTDEKLRARKKKEKERVLWNPAQTTSFWCGCQIVKFHHVTEISHSPGVSFECKAVSFHKYSYRLELDRGSSCRLFLIKLLIGGHAQQGKNENQKVCNNFQTFFEMEKEGKT